MSDTYQYFNWELSANGRHALWVEPVTAGEDTQWFVWYARVSATGRLNPTTQGRDRLLGQMLNINGLPQWGQDDGDANVPASTRHYGVFPGPDGYWRRVRATSAGPPTVELIVDDSTQSERTRRTYPFLARHSGDEQWLAYQLRDVDTVALELVNLLAPTQRTRLHEEPKTTPWSTLAAVIVNLQRWVPGSTTLTFGVFDDGCNLNCPAQVAVSDPAIDIGASENVTPGDVLSKWDVFPFRRSSRAFFLAGLDGSADGALYRQGDDGVFRLHRHIDFDPAQSDLPDPWGAQSFETFLWNGEYYAAYHIMGRPAVENAPVQISGGGQHSYPGEIWVVKPFAEPVIRCKVSAADTLPDAAMGRFEPEPAVVNGSAFIYYSIGAPNPDILQYEHALRRIDLGDQAIFDATCAAGEIPGA